MCNVEYNVTPNKYSLVEINNTLQPKVSRLLSGTRELQYVPVPEFCIERSLGAWRQQPPTVAAKQKTPSDVLTKRRKASARTSNSCDVNAPMSDKIDDQPSNDVDFSHDRLVNASIGNRVHWQFLFVMIVKNTLLGSLRNLNAITSRHVAVLKQVRQHLIYKLESNYCSSTFRLKVRSDERVVRSRSTIRSYRSARIAVPFHLSPHQCLLTDEQVSCGGQKA